MRLIVLTLLLMVIIGVTSFAGTLLFWEGKPAPGKSCWGLLSTVVGLFGFLAPGVVVWYLQKRQFSLRALLIATALIALVLGILTLVAC